MNNITKRLAAALRDCYILAYNCHRDELPDAIITTASKAIAEYDATQSTSGAKASSSPKKKPPSPSAATSKIST